MSFSYEYNRLMTFKDWNISYIDKNELAKHGFYYIGPDDIVKCYFCRIEIGRWEDGDIVLDEHKKWSPRCPLICNNIHTNIPINNENMINIIKTSNTVSEGSIESLKEDDIHAFPHSSFNENTNKKKYDMFSNRLESYKNWPTFLKQLPESLCDAGFYYTGYNDYISCFYCGIGLNSWEIDVDPWTTHIKYNDSCEYLKTKKGKDFINKIKSKFLNSNRIVNDTTNSLLNSNSISKNNYSCVCIICCEEEINTILIPCKHVIMCKECVSKVNTCPKCRTSIKKSEQIYLG